MRPVASSQSQGMLGLSPDQVGGQAFQDGQDRHVDGCGSKSCGQSICGTSCDSIGAALEQVTGRCESGTCVSPSTAKGDSTSGTRGSLYVTGGITASADAISRGGPHVGENDPGNSSPMGSLYVGDQLASKNLGRSEGTGGRRSRHERISKLPQRELKRSRPYCDVWKARRSLRWRSYPRQRWRWKRHRKRWIRAEQR